MPAPPPPADLASLSLADIARLAEARKLPPVESWNPSHCGHSGMRITRDGTWFHEGRPIDRPALVRLFSTILRREPDGSHVLVTPVEKLEIDVEDAPFVVVELKTEGVEEARSLAFRLNTGDVLVAGPEHPIAVELHEDGPRPYLDVRPGLRALVTRPVYYELAELCLEEGADPPGLWSRGVFFRMDGQS